MTAAGGGAGDPNPAPVGGAEGPTPSPVDEDDLRRAAGHFPSGVCVVTAVAGGLDHASTATAFTTVSLDPPLVLVCLYADARVLEAVQAAGCWAVSVLAHDQAPVADWLATPGRPVRGQLERVPFRRGTTGSPLVEGAVAALECRTWAVHPGGDHEIVVGEVVAVHAPSPAPPPLLHHRGRYRRLAER